MATKTISELDIAGRRVFIRVDFNVPLTPAGAVADDTRVRESLPTIKHAIEKGARVVLASHLGRPKGRPDKKLSLEPVAAKLAELLGAEVALTDEPVGDGARKVVNDLRAGAVAMLENLRFSPLEEENDESFSRALAGYADVFVNDAFGTAHRAHASTVGIAKLVAEQGDGPPHAARGDLPREVARRGRAPVRDHRGRCQGLRQDRRAAQSPRPGGSGPHRRRDGEHVSKSQGRKARPLPGGRRQDGAGPRFSEEGRGAQRRRAAAA